MPYTFENFLKQLKAKNQTVTISLTANCFPDPDEPDLHPLYIQEGIIKRVGKDYLLMDVADIAFADAEPNIVAIPFSSIAFIWDSNREGEQ